MTFPSQTKTKRVKNPLHQKILREIVAGRDSARNLAGILYRDKAHRTVLHRLMCYRLSCDGAELCSDKKPCFLRKTSIDDLMDISWDNIIAEWRERSELLYEVLEAVTTKVHLLHCQPKSATSNFPSIGLAGSVLLNSRNPSVCRIQTAIGLILDQGGATDEVI